MGKALTYKQVVDALKKHDSLFAMDKIRGKGSHRMVTHPKTTRHYPLPYHGAKTNIPQGMQRDLIRLFDLPSDIFS